MKKELDKIVIDFTISEIENLLRMNTQCERFMLHEQALTDDLIRKIQKARGIYIARFGEDALPPKEIENEYPC